MKRARPAAVRLAAADLHVPTTHSDGSCSPCEVVNAAAAVGLSALAITDHDTLSARAVARPEAARLGVELIAGVELTAEHEEREVHILGHFVGDDDPALRVARSGRLQAMGARLVDLGLWVDVRALEHTFPRATLGRRHLAEWLARTRQVASPRAAFACFLGDGGPAKVPKPRLPWDEAIGLIRGAGGVAGLAHPPYDLRELALRTFVDAGRGAIEVAGLGTPARQGRCWRDWANQFGLIPIAGSDFHAPNRPGRWAAAITTPATDLGRLREK